MCVMSGWLVVGLRPTAHLLPSLLVGPGPVGDVPSVGVFLRNAIPYLRQ